MVNHVLFLGNVERLNVIAFLFCFLIEMFINLFIEYIKCLFPFLFKSNLGPKTCRITHFLIVF